MKLLRLVALVTGLVLVGILASSGLPGTVDAAGLKIDPRVRTATANGGRAPVLIVLSEQADLSGADRLTSKQEKGRYVFNMLVSTARRTQPAVKARLDALGYSYRAYYIVNMFAVENATQAGIEQLVTRSDIARIESNARVRMDLPQPVRVPSMDGLTASSIPWGVQKIRAPAVWSLGIRGQGIVYANADTGINWTHPALKPHYRGYNGGLVNHNYNWWDAVHGDVSGEGTNSCGFSSPVPCDDYGHGTHTLGTGIGDDYRGNVIGVAPLARWIGCRNMEDGWGTPAQYIECFQFFLAPWDLSGNNPNPYRNADVISNSWTCPPKEGCDAETLRAAVRAERSAGIFVVASAGNAGYLGCSSITDPPAIYPATFTVGATDILDNLAGFSSLGPVTVNGSNHTSPDLAAPGVGVVSALKGGGYGTMSGTSMAAPHVAGAVALLWRARPSLLGKVAWTEQILFNSAYRGVVTNSACGGTTSKVIPNDMFGYGRLDVYRAVQAINR